MRTTAPLSLTLLLLLILPAWATPSPDGLQAIGSDLALWVVEAQPAAAETAPDLPDLPDVWVLHGAVAPSLLEQSLAPAVQLTGSLAPGGLAAHGQTLWLVFADRTVQSVQAIPATTPSGWRYQGDLAPALPEGSTLLAFSATAEGPVALIRLPQGPALDRLEPLPPRRSPATTAQDPAAAGDASRPLLLGLPPNLPSSRDTRRPATDRPSPAATEPVAEAPQELRLIRRVAGSWRHVDLPEDWPADLSADDGVWLLQLQSRDPLPAVLLRTARQPGELLLFRFTADQTWTTDRLEVPAASLLLPRAVDGQLLLAEPVTSANAADATQAQLSVHLARPPHRYPLGTLHLPSATATAPLLVPLGQRLAWLQRTPSPEPAQAAPRRSHTPLLFPPPAWPVPELELTTLDLQGQTEAPYRLTPVVPSFLDRLARSLTLVSLLAFAAVLLALFWQRDAGLQPVQLPADWQLADLTRRWTAGLIDLLPAIAAASAWTGSGIGELLLRWPGNTEGHSWAAIEPGLTAMGFFLLHTLIGELCFATTLGKHLLGLRVVTRTGQRPRPWQMLVRGLLKGLDLIAWMLLLLPLLSPARQRFGDLLAGTVVVSRSTPTPPDASPPSN